MKNELYLNAVTQDFLDDFQRDYNVELIGKETDEAEDVETACSWNGHQVGYCYAHINRISFEAEGFKLHHPNGAIISGLFPKPVKALEVINDAYGYELENDEFDRELRAAIVAKCGRISRLADCGLI